MGLWPLPSGWARGADQGFPIGWRCSARMTQLKYRVRRRLPMGPGTPLEKMRASTRVMGRTPPPELAASDGGEVTVTGR